MSKTNNGAANADGYLVQISGGFVSIASHYNEDGPPVERSLARVFLTRVDANKFIGRLNNDLNARVVTA